MARRSRFAVPLLVVAAAVLFRASVHAFAGFGRHQLGSRRPTRSQLGAAEYSDRWQASAAGQEESVLMSLFSTRMVGAVLSLLASVVIVVTPIAQAQAIGGTASSAPATSAKKAAPSSSQPSKFATQMNARPPASALTGTTASAPAQPSKFAAQMNARPPAAALAGNSKPAEAKPAESKFAAQMNARPPASALKDSKMGSSVDATSSSQPSKFAAQMNARPPAAALAGSTATKATTVAAPPVATPAPAPGPTAPTAAPAAKAPAPAPAPPAEVNNRVIVNEKIVYAEPQVISPPMGGMMAPPMGGMMAPPMGGMVAAPMVAAPPPPSLGDVVVGVGAAMAVKAVADAIAPSPEKQMQDQMRKDERALDKQAEDIAQLQKQLLEAKAASASK